MNPTIEQQQIFSLALEDSRHLFVEALAGTGKSTTIRQAVQQVHEKHGISQLVLAFNRSTADQMDMNIGDIADVYTLHSWGKQILNEWCKQHRGHYCSMRKGRQNGLWKYWNILSKLKGRDEICDNFLVVKFCECARNLGLREKDITEDWIVQSSYLYGIFVRGVESKARLLVPILREMLTRGLADLKLIDFADMLYAPYALGIAPARKYPIVYVDEAQDLNHPQIYLTLASGERIVNVGDSNQAIYAWRGADNTAIDTMRTQLGIANTISAPLTICWRCSRKVISEAQTVVPEIKPRPNAPEGSVEIISSLPQKIQHGAMILCRNNAPLFKCMFDLVDAGHKVCITGKDISKTLQSFLSLMEFDPDYNLQTVWSEASQKVEKLAVNKQQRAQFRDLADILTTVITRRRCRRVEDVLDFIKDCTSDTMLTDGINLSTVHRAKGLEAPQVIIIAPELLEREDKHKQDRNLKYVAYTRAIDTLQILPEVYTPDWAGSAEYAEYDSEEEEIKEEQTTTERYERFSI